MDLAAICEVLQATQLADETIRKAAEQKLEDAKANSLNELVQALVAVLAAAGNVAPELRQQAAVLLRQRVREDWDEFQMNTCQGLKSQILASMESDAAVRRNVGQVATAIAQEGCDDLEKLMKHWPELLPWLAAASVSGETQCRAIAIGVLKELSRSIGDDLLKNPQVKDMLAKALSDPAAEIRAAGAQFVFALIQHLDDDAHDQLREGMPAVTAVLQGLATGSTENELNETLGALALATEEEPLFFFENNFEPLWQTLTTICNAGAATFGVPEIRHTAMESMMTIAEGCNDEDEFKQHLEGLMTINLKWMLEVENDVAIWTAEGKDTGEDGEIDDDVVRISEENFDRIATSFDEDDFMPALFKVVSASGQSSEWVEVRAAIMAVNQIVEHLEEEDRMDQAIDFIMRHFEHPHPRVRYVAFAAIAQCAFDQADRLNGKYAAHILPKILKGMQDDNIRVATAAVEAFGALGSNDLDADDCGLEDHMEELLTLLFKHLDAGQSIHLQEQCIECISLAARAVEDTFGQYYGQVMPLLKTVIGTATKAEQRNLRGQAFLSASEIGEVVGKEIFAKDACEIMDVMVPIFQAGFAADDKTRELAHEACGHIAQTIGKDFKGYVAALLPSVLQVLSQEPKDVADLLDDDDDFDNIILNDVGALGLKTSVLEEMDDALELVIILAKSLEEEFCSFIGVVCQALFPLLEYPMSEDVRETTSRLWGMLSSLARSGVDKGVLQANVLQDLVAEFLKRTIGNMGQNNTEDICETNVTLCTKLQTLANGAADVILKAGPGVLSREAMTDVAKVIGQLIAQIDCSKLTVADGKRKKKRDPETIDDEDEPDAEDDNQESEDATPQTVRFALCDVMSALMQTNAAEFAEGVLPTLLGQLVPKLVQDSSCDADRSFGFYIADQAVEFMGERSVQYWELFMNHALVAVTHKSPLVQQYAAKVVGTGARQPQYSVMALAACQSVYSVIQKHGEKHKRRRATADKKPTALAMDACVRALGLICEHQEAQLGQHASVIWNMWVSSLPIKYDVEKAHQVHAQLLGLLGREHPGLVDGDKLPTVVRVLIDVHKTKLSTPDLDKNIALAITALGRERLEVLSVNFKDGHKKKIEHILKKNEKPAGTA